jgi:hypothetical protein
MLLTFVVDNFSVTSERANMVLIFSYICHDVEISRICITFLIQVSLDFCWALDFSMAARPMILLFNCCLRSISSAVCALNS